MKEKEIYKILNKIQKELKAPKNQYNKFGNYNYRNCEDIIEAIKPLLPDGVILTLHDDIREVGGRFYIESEAKITDGTDSISSKALAREPQSKKGFDESQITGAASSYARKYALNGLFCIDDTKDADSDDNSKNQQDNNHIKNMEYDEYMALVKAIDEAADIDSFNIALDKAKAGYGRMSKKWQEIMTDRIKKNKFYNKKGE